MPDSSKIAITVNNNSELITEINDLFSNAGWLQDGNNPYVWRSPIEIGEGRARIWFQEEADNSRIIFRAQGEDLSTSAKSYDIPFAVQSDDIFEGFCDDYAFVVHVRQFGNSNYQTIFGGWQEPAYHRYLWGLGEWLHPKSGDHFMIRRTSTGIDFRTAQISSSFVTSPIATVDTIQSDGYTDSIPLMRPYFGTRNMGFWGHPKHVFIGANRRDYSKISKPGDPRIFRSTPGGAIRIG